MNQHVSRCCDVHYSPDDGGYYGQCYAPSCRWVGPIRSDSTVATEDAQRHQLKHER